MVACGSREGEVSIFGGGWNGPKWEHQRQNTNRGCRAALPCANGAAPAIALTLLRVINEVTDPPVMKTPQDNCPTNEKNVSSLSI